MDDQNCIIYCNCGADIISSETKKKLRQSINKLRIDFFELHDICSVSLNEKEFLNEIEKKYIKKYIVACYPRAVKNIFAQNKVELTNFEVLNFRENNIKRSIEDLKNKVNEKLDTPLYETKKSSLKVPAWYPVVEQNRCSLCGQCARFCLFGVYKYNKRGLEVTNPLSCKNNCPACGRTCPTSAIIFPRLTENSVLSGDEPENKIKQTQKEGLFVRLNERNSNRKEIFKQGLMQQAEEERKRAIEELKKGFEKK